MAANNKIKLRQIDTDELSTFVQSEVTPIQQIYPGTGIPSEDPQDTTSGNIFYDIHGGAIYGWSTTGLEYVKLYNPADFYPSGNPSGYVVSGDLEIYVTAEDVSAAFYPRDNPSGYVSSGDISGIFYQSAFEQRIVTSVPTGIDNLYISFNSAFVATPMVAPSIYTSGTFITYDYAITGVDVSGYYLAFSDIITESGIVIFTIAKEIN